MAKNVIQNPSAEEGAANPRLWIKQVHTLVVAQHIWETADANSGSKSLRCVISEVKTTGVGAGWRQTIPKSILHEGRTYEASVYYKSTGPLDLIVDFKTGAGSMILREFIRLPPSPTWTQSDILTLTTPSGPDWISTKTINIRVIMRETGDFLVDDFDMHIVLASDEAIVTFTSHPVGAIYIQPEGIATFEIITLQGTELQVQVTSQMDTTLIFDHWEKDNVNIGTANPINITVDFDTTIKAVFTALPPPSPCFIATATYGYPTTLELTTFRKFRDRFLPSQLVKLYYTLSPPFANLITFHRRIRQFVKYILDAIYAVLKNNV